MYFAADLYFSVLICSASFGKLFLEVPNEFVFFSESIVFFRKRSFLFSKFSLQTHIILTGAAFFSCNLIRIRFIERLRSGSNNLEKVFKEIQCDGKLSMYELFSKYHKIFAYFDDWVFIKSDDVYKDITEILVKKKGDAHLETCTW